MRRTAAALAFFLTATGLALVAVVVAAFLLPDTVPTHFDLGGAANDWSTRAGAVSFLAALNVGLSGLFGLLAWKAPTIPWEWINLPGKERWAELGRQNEVRRSLRTDLWWLGAVTALFCLAVTVAEVEAARARNGQLPGWFVLSFIAWLVVVAGYTTFSLVRYRAPTVSGRGEVTRRRGWKT